MRISDWSSDVCSSDLDKGLKEVLAVGLEDSHQAAKFAEMIIYCPVSGDNDDQFAALADRVSDRMDKGFSIYLSTPPSLFAPTAMALKKAGLTGPNSRIAMEKPIGHDLPSCREVNEVMGSIFDEDRIFRVDHYLGKETVQNLLALRFVHMLFEPLWNNHAIETSAERREG